MYRFVEDDRFNTPVLLTPSTASANGHYFALHAESALAEFQRLANEGNLDARATLALIKATGSLGQEPNLPAARELVELGASRDHAYSQHVMAWLLVEENQPLHAVQYMRQAARQGFSPALLDMGRFYLNGIGVTKDRRIAMEWLWRAYKAGHAVAKRYILQQYRAGHFGRSRKWLGHLIWPLTTIWLRGQLKLHGGYTESTFIYNWPHAVSAETKGRAKNGAPC
ncbi:MAG: tetratricopeptide repeat protein [Steroidobacteraceae bacterium]